MKKILSAIMVISMLLCMIAIFPVSAAEGNVLSSETVDLYVSDRINTTDSTKKDVRFVLVANVEYLKSFDALTLAVAFADASGNAAGAISFDVFADLTFMETAVGAGETYVADEGCAIFGIVVEGAPVTAFASVSATLTADAESDPVLDGYAALTTWLESAEEIVNAAYALEEGATLDGTYTLTGIITKINTAYSASYNNISVTIDVEGSDKDMYCFRMEGEGIDQLAVGDEITVTGSFTNYSGTIEYEAGCTLDSWVDNTEEEVVLSTPEEIVNAAYALESGSSLNKAYTLTGVIISVDTAYDASYSNVTVTIVVGNMTDKPIMCFRMKGDGADVIGVNDEITVTGTLKNYYGTIEFDTGCTLDSYVDNEDPEAPEVPAGSTVVSVTFSEQGYSNAQAVTAVDLDDVISLSASKGTGSTAPAYYNSGTAFRLYGGNTLTVSATDGYVIESIVIVTASGSSYTIKTDNHTVTNGTAAISGATVTITPTDGSADVVLARTGTSGHFRILSITVTYAEAE